MKCGLARTMRAKHHQGAVKSAALGCARPPAGITEITEITETRLPRLPRLPRIGGTEDTEKVKNPTRTKQSLLVLRTIPTYNVRYKKVGDPPKKVPKPWFPVASCQKPRTWRDVGRYWAKSLSEAVQNPCFEALRPCWRALCERNLNSFWSHI